MKHDDPQGETPRAATSARTSLVLPDRLCAAVLRGLDQVAGGLIAVGVSANLVTGSCIALGMGAGILLAFGQFGLATMAMVVASLGDAVDGLVARKSRSASVAGALLDASGDRYQEFFFLGGLAVLFRESPAALVAALLAIAGSFMVSYSSAKAEALGVPVPPGVMRRAERAVCLCVATGLTLPWQRFVAPDAAPTSWAALLPLLVAVSLIAVVANASAMHRLWLIAHGAPSVPADKPAPDSTPDNARVARELARESSV